MNHHFMKEALKESLISYNLNEIPVGCIIVKNDEIISRGHNLKEKTNISTNHAEIISINKACEKSKSWRLTNCSMYVTLEPCIMCAGAILESRIKNLYIGTPNIVGGFFTSNFHKHFPNLNIIWMNVITSQFLLNKFFQKMRKR